MSAVEITMKDMAVQFVYVVVQNKTIATADLKAALNWHDYLASRGTSDARDDLWRSLRHMIPTTCDELGYSVVHNGRMWLHIETNAELTSAISRHLGAELADVLSELKRLRPVKSLNPGAYARLEGLAQVLEGTERLIRPEGVDA